MTKKDVLQEYQKQKNNKIFKSTLPLPTGFTHACRDKDPTTFVAFEASSKPTMIILKFSLGLYLHQIEHNCWIMKTNYDLHLMIYYES